MTTPNNTPDERMTDLGGGLVYYTRHDVEQPADSGGGDDEQPDHGTP